MTNLACEQPKLIASIFYLIVLPIACLPTASTFSRPKTTRRNEISTKPPKLIFDIRTFRQLAKIAKHLTRRSHPFVPLAGSPRDFAVPRVDVSILAPAFALQRNIGSMERRTRIAPDSLVLSCSFFVPLRREIWTEGRGGAAKSTERRGRGERGKGEKGIRGEGGGGTCSWRRAFARDLSCRFPGLPAVDDAREEPKGKGGDIFGWRLWGRVEGREGGKVRGRGGVEPAGVSLALYKHWSFAAPAHKISHLTSGSASPRTGDFLRGPKSQRVYRCFEENERVKNSFQVSESPSPPPPLCAGIATRGRCEVLY